MSIYTRIRINTLFGLSFFVCLLSSIIQFSTTPTRYAQNIVPSTQQKVQVAHDKTVNQGQQSPHISRLAFNRIYQNGLQRIIANVRIKPVMKGKRFIGFQLMNVVKGSLVAQAGFKTGDVIMQVNGEPIGRPQQMMRVWDLLHYAPHLKITYQRDGVLQQKQWMIGEP